ncbi:MAG: hypothetical protein P1V97_11215 [Planctomycetota bacterium]|nr:hypothetical protein [Planctomycetota bacterium]
MPEAEKNFCDRCAGFIQDQLEGLLSQAKQEQLNTHLESCESCQTLSRSFMVLEESLAIRPALPPENLHQSIMLRVDRFRQRERLYRWGSVSLLAASVLGLAFFYQEPLAILSGTLSAVPGEVTEVLRPGAFFESFTGNWSLAGDTSLPLAVLVLLPFFVLVNFMTLRSPEVNHA